MSAAINRGNVTINRGSAAINRDNDSVKGATRAPINRGRPMRQSATPRPQKVSTCGSNTVLVAPARDRFQYGSRDPLLVRST
eukprot:3940251-Rhodomonas_salina.1